MLKNAFNKVAQFAEDAAFGWALPGMDGSRRLRVTAFGGAGAVLGAVGILSNDASAIVIGTGVVASAAFAFQQRGANIRHALEAQPK